MVWSSLRICEFFEVLVVLFQLIGVTTLCLHRFLPRTRWAGHGRIGFIVAIFGLGVAGALCGRHDSEFGLFAGGTMTVLLIAMTIGSSASDSTGISSGLINAEA
jgi:uncharacterized membrane protein YcfT